MRSAPAEESNGSIGLYVNVVRVAAALASAIVILLDLFLEDIEVGNPLSGSVDAEDRLLLPRGGLPGGGSLPQGVNR
jgi:hypothetical protein